MSKLVLVAFALAALTASPAAAHVTLEKRQAPVGSYYKAVFAVPHGCAGSPTIKLRVQIPEGVIGIKPMPKRGWTVETVTALSMIFTAANCPKASKKWCGAAASLPTTISMNSSFPATSRLA
jgi:uncharacterized protein YcnI